MKGPKVMRAHVIGGNNVNGVVLGENVNSIKSVRLSENSFTVIKKVFEERQYLGLFRQ